MHNNYLILTLLATFFFAATVFAADPVAKPPAVAVPAMPLLKRCTSVTVDPPTYVVLGKSIVVALNSQTVRMLVSSSVSGAGHAGKATEATDKNDSSAALATKSSDGVAELDILLLSPRELFLSGKKAGSRNVVLQNAEGHCTVKDLIVTVDPAPLQTQLNTMMPEEAGIKVKGAENTLVLVGQVSDSLKLDQVMSLATSYGDGKRVVNLLRVTAPQQVMLEVKIAEVSKTLIDKIGASLALNRSSSGGRNAFTLMSSFLTNGGGLLQALEVGRTTLNIDGQKNDGLVRILAEPTIMAISGQSASFLSGGKIFIPVAQTAATGGSLPVVTLQEKEFGIGVKFTPTVLDGSRINLKLVSEVSDLSQSGSPFTSINDVVSIIPSMTVRRADTTVQLNDGQSFVIAGLIKNNSTEAIKRFPGLGEIPVLGALFRSSEFQKDQTELLFVITPRLVKPLTETPVLPTSNHVEPSRSERYLNGSLEATTPTPAEPQ